MWCYIISIKNLNTHQSLGYIPNKIMLNHQVYAFKPLTDIAKSPPKGIVLICTSMSTAWVCLLPHTFISGVC